MKRDLSIISGGIIAIGIAAQLLWGNPEPSSAAHVHSEQAFHDDPNLRLVSEQSQYMRNER